SESTGGKRSSLLELNTSARYAVGLSLDAGRLTYVVTDLAGNVIGRLVSPGIEEAGPSEDVVRIARELGQLLVQLDIALESVARGASSNVGEIGHLVVDIDGPQCWCGDRGCLEMLAAPRAVVAAALEDDDLADRLQLTRDPQRFRADFEAIARAAAQGEPRCCE